MIEAARPPVEIMVHPDEESRRKIAACQTCGGFLTVAEGAVRSGKTATLLVAFAVYVIRSPERVFLLSGRTIKTAEQNCILETFGLLNLIPGSKYRKVGESRAIVFSVPTPDGRTVSKKIIVVGASDIRAYMLIRGNSYGGWFADEVNMHDKEFVSEALRRTVVSTDRRHYFSLNPDSPQAWIYEEYLDRYDAMTEEEKEELGGYHWFHFTPKDNPVMTPKMLKSLEAQFPKNSFLYARYVEGKRVQAEGLVYPMITASMFRPQSDMVGTAVNYCAIDFGSSHATAMMFGGMFNGNRNDWRIVEEYYDKDSGKIPYDYYVGFLDVCKRLKADPNNVYIAIDPAAKTLRLEFEKHGLRVIKAKNDVLNGIEFTRSALVKGTLLISETCKNLRREFASYSWNEKAKGKDEVVKENDDAVDALRYFAYTFIKPITGA